MRVYEIPEKGGRISSESRTEQPRKKGNVFSFQNAIEFFHTSEEVGLQGNKIILFLFCSPISRPT